MNEIIKNIEAAQMKAEVPQFNVGDTVRVHGKIKEGNRERIQIFERVEVIRRGKVRRAKLNSLRQRVGKAAKVKELVK